jgi:hypothetical protein
MKKPTKAELKAVEEALLAARDEFRATRKDRSEYERLMSLYADLCRARVEK